MAEHTPGPWHWKDEQLWGKDGNVMTVQFIDEGFDAAGRPEWSWSLDLGPEDADLIAAAPDLLAACEATLHYVDVTHSWTDAKHCLQLVRRAVKKANGEANV